MLNKSSSAQKPGPIEGLFYAQFHSTYGPQLKYQYPPSPHTISQETFEKLTNFIIPKPETMSRIVCINTRGIKIKGFPNKIKDTKYERNELLFNLCLVFKPDARTGPFDPLIQKLSEYLHSLEIENGFLSNEESQKQLPLILEQLYFDLNIKGQCILKLKLQDPLKLLKEEGSASGESPVDSGERRLSLSRRAELLSFDRRNCVGRNATGERGSIGGGGGGRPGALIGGPGLDSCGGRGCAMDRDTLTPEHIAVLYLKVVDACGSPTSVGEEQVPILMKPEVVDDIHNLDLTTQQLLPFIDGVAHVAKIAHCANVELDLAKKCVQDLLYYEIVQLIPIFQYSNTYVTTKKLSDFYWNTVLQQKCLEYVIGDPAKRQLSVDDVMRLYSKFTLGRTVKDICYCELDVVKRCNKNADASKKLPPPSFYPPAPNVDIRRLVNFGLLQGIIRRVQQYPVHVPTHSKKGRRIDSFGTLSPSLRKYCDGTSSFDLLCSKFGMSHKELSSRLNQEKDIKILWR